MLSSGANGELQRRLMVAFTLRKFREGGFGEIFTLITELLLRANLKITLIDYVSIIPGDS